jgi:hypothetical protein
MAILDTEERGVHGGGGKQWCGTGDRSTRNGCMAVPSSPLVAGEAVGELLEAGALSMAH